MMAYAKGFVVSVITNDGPQRESNASGERVVRIPFGSEYKLRLKNPNSVRCLAQVKIDGVNVSSIGKMIIGPHQHVDLERFIDDMHSGRKFKFVSREEGASTGSLQDPTSMDLGKIEVVFWKEKSLHFHQSGLLRGIHSNHSNPAPSSASVMKSVYPDATSFQYNAAMDWNEVSNTATHSSVGGTAEGSESKQRFVMGEDFEVENDPVAITIKLLGSSAPFENPKFQVTDGWVVRLQDGSRITNTFRVENGKIWGLLS